MRIAMVFAEKATIADYISFQIIQKKLGYLKSNENLKI